MDFTYALYLLLALAGTLAFVRIFGLSFSSKQVKAIIISLFSTTIIFAAWDAWAAEQKHWSFGLQHMINSFIGNLPLEEVAFFLVIPFFGIVVWEIVGKYTSWSGDKG